MARVHKLDLHLDLLKTPLAQILLDLRSATEHPFCIICDAYFPESFSLVQSDFS